ncbi:hypothetical protein I4U23_009421 [Adineta vaga]|nr:hypothetical protein I4U23_009421 [Adineta vaga]
MVVLFENPRALPVATFLMQVFITLVVCKILAKLLSYIRQPQVIGQIIAGIIFGPSVLGNIPAWTNAIWPEESLDAFKLIANLGLIFFMFFLGIELDLDQIKRSWKVTIPIAVVSIVIPVGIGCAVSIWLYEFNENLHKSEIAFILFIGSGFGFSAFPVLATLLNAMDLLNKPIGIQTISLAAVEDIVVWVILAVASAFSSGGSALQGLYTLLLTLAFIGIMIFIIRPILKWIHGCYLRREDDTNVYLVVGCFLLLLIASFTTEVMGIHAFFGAFISGLCIPRRGELSDFLAIRIELIIVEFFLPLYFANSGLHTQLNLLNTGNVWWILVVLILMASTAKIVPVTLVSKLCSKKPWFYCLSIGVLMNTRGIVQLVVLNIGVELGVISPKIFAIFVLMATILTLFTSPILSVLYRKNYDIRKLSVPNIAGELRHVREEERDASESNDDLNHIETISGGDVGYNPAKRSSIKSRRKSSTIPPTHSAMVTFDDHVNYADIDIDAIERDSVDDYNIVRIATSSPRRSIYPRHLPFATFLMQVFITLVVCKILAKLLSYIRQPQVIGQIIAGIIFGPSVLGNIPAWTNVVWPESSLKTFQLIANLGLIFFMFFLGLELDLDQIKRSWKITIPVAIASVIIPVGLGCAVSLWLYEDNEGLHTTVEDIVVWVILAVASAFSSGGSALQGLYTLLLTLAFIGIMIFIIRPILKWIHGCYLRREDDTNVYLVVGCFLLLLIASFTTEVMGIHAFFAVRIQLIIVEFFLPLYFANSGLHTHLNLLNSGKAWWMLVVLILMASTAKIVPVTLVSKLCSKKPWFYCLSIGVLMNTRGIVQLVVLNIGVELGVISPKIFAIFVLMATILTFLTSPILSVLYQKSYDAKKSSTPNVPEELRNIPTIAIRTPASSEKNSYAETLSNGRVNSGLLKHNTIESMKKLSVDLLPQSSSVVFDNRISYIEINPHRTDENYYEDSSDEVQDTISRSMNMTRF